MRKIKNYILRNWLLIVGGCILQAKAVHVGVAQRGTFVIGGDMLILPFALLTAELVRAAIRVGIELIEEERAWEG